MPIHDWTRVSDGTFHDFHVAWIAELRSALNEGILPPTYYAQAEQVIGPLGPDILTLQSSSSPGNEPAAEQMDSGGLAVAAIPPRSRVTAAARMDDYLARRRTVVIRHSSGDRIVALLEILSPGNKSSRHALRSFVEKAIESLYGGYHLLIIDLFPPTERDPQGIHGAIWSEISDERFQLPAGEPLTLAAYSAGSVKKAWVEPTAVGKSLVEMPLFLDPDT